MEGSNPLFSEGWSGWPKDANQDDVLSWFADLCEKLAAFAEDYKSTTGTAQQADPGLHRRTQDGHRLRERPQG
jgi:hypothetical protein